MAFLDSHQQIVTCSQTSCQDCPVQDKLHCHFSAGDLGHFLVTALPIFLVAGIAIFRVGWLYLIPFVLIIIGYFLFLEIRVMCSHCPHYAEDGPTLQCWANYGAPRLWKYRPGPMNRWEVIIFYSGLAVVILYPVVLMILSAQWTLLILMVATTTSGATTLLRSFCAQCFNFACPLNRVPESTREQFLTRNPTVARAWELKS